LLSKPVENDSLCPSTGQWRASKLSLEGRLSPTQILYRFRHISVKNWPGICIKICPGTSVKSWPFLVSPVEEAAHNVSSATKDVTRDVGHGYSGCYVYGSVKHVLNEGCGLVSTMIFRALSTTCGGSEGTLAVVTTKFVSHV
jgi:hypothetical protein